MRWNDGLRNSGMEASTRYAFQGRWVEGYSGVALQHHRYQRTGELKVLDWSGPGTAGIPARVSGPAISDT